MLSSEGVWWHRGAMAQKRLPKVILPYAWVPIQSYQMKDQALFPVSFFRCDRNSLTRQSLRWSVQPISSRSCSIPSSDILTLQYTKKWLLRFKIIQKHVLFFLGIRELLKGFCCQILMGKLTQRSEMSDINCELKEFLEKVHIARWWF